MYKGKRKEAKILLGLTKKLKDQEQQLLLEQSEK